MKNAASVNGPLYKTKESAKNNVHLKLLLNQKKREISRERKVPAPSVAFFAKYSSAASSSDLFCSKIV